MVGTNATPPALARAWRRESMSSAIRISAQVEELAPALHRAHPSHEELEVGITLDEIQVFGVDGQHRCRIVMVKEARVALGEHREVFLGDAALEAGRAP